MTATMRERTIKPGWLTGRNQISQYTGHSKRTISRLIAEGKIPCKRLGHRLVMIRISELDAALERM